MSRKSRRLGGGSLRALGTATVLIAMLSGCAVSKAQVISPSGNRPAKRSGSTGKRLEVMTWNTCANTKPKAPGTSRATCVNGRRTDKVAAGIRWHMRRHTGLQVVFLQEICYADVKKLRTLGGMSGWRFRFAGIKDRGSGAKKGSHIKPRRCASDSRTGAGRGNFGIAVGVHAATSFSVHYFPKRDVPNARDRWGQWNVHQVAICGKASSYGVEVCGTHLTPLGPRSGPKHRDEFWTSQAGEAKELIRYAGTKRPVVVGGDLNSRPPDAKGGHGDKSTLVPLYSAYSECDQKAHGGKRTGTGTFQSSNGKRSAKYDYIFANKKAGHSCHVTKKHVTQSDHVPVTDTVTFPST